MPTSPSWLDTLLKLLNLVAPFLLEWFKRRPAAPAKRQKTTRRRGKTGDNTATGPRNKKRCRPAATRSEPQLGLPRNGLFSRKVKTRPAKQQGQRDVRSRRGPWMGPVPPSPSNPKSRGPKRPRR